MDKRPSVATITSSTHNLVEVSTRRRLLGRKKKKIAFLLLPLLAGLAFLFFVLFIIFHIKYTTLLGKEVCTTEDCIEAANMLLEVMDRKKDPCNDFFAYACGNYDQAHPLPDGRIIRSWFEEGEERLTRMVQNVLEDSGKPTTSKSLKMAKQFYRSCVNKDQTEALGLEPLYELLEKMGLPKFPNKDTAEQFNLGKTLGLLQRYINTDVIVQIGIARGELQPGGDNDTFILEISPIVAVGFSALYQEPTIPDMRPALKLLHKTPNLAEVIRNDPSTFDVSIATTPEQVLLQRILFMGTIMKNILNDLETGNADTSGTNETELLKDAIKILTFTASLDEVIADAKNDSGSEVEAMTLAQLQAVLQDFSPSTDKGNGILWKDYLQAVFDEEKGYWKYDYDQDLTMIKTVGAFKALSTFLGTTKPLTIQRYIWWVVVSEFARFTTEEMEAAYRKLYEGLLGRATGGTTRTRTCVANVRKLLNFPLALEIKNVFGLANHTEKVVEMLNDIRKEFESLVYSINWMDLHTKLLNIKKARAIESSIGYEEAVLDEKTVDEHYRELKIGETTFLKNMVAFKEWEVRKVLRLLKQSNASVGGPLREATNPIQVNAYYARTSNAICKSMNYGAIGSILGHELTHGFDSEGKNYDEHGKQQHQIWSQEITQHYEHRAQCFVKQYGEFYLYKKKRVNGTYTLAENIADNGGLRETYYAYQSFVKRHGPEKKLPGFEAFTPEQLLFISFATLWCETHSDAYRHLVLHDVHSPNRVRVIATLQNMKEFAAAFQCPARSFMNPDKKCIIW